MKGEEVGVKGSDVEEHNIDGIAEAAMSAAAPAAAEDEELTEEQRGIVQCSRVAALARNAFEDVVKF